MQQRTPTGVTYAVLGRGRGDHHDPLPLDALDLAQEQPGLYLYPPQWIPDPIRIANYGDVLSLVPFCDLRPEQPDHRRQRDVRHAALLLLHRLRLCPSARSRPRRHLHGRAGHPDAADDRHPGPDLHRLQQARLDQHLPAPDRPGLLRHPLLHLPAAPVLPVHPAGAGRGGQARRRQPPTASGGTSCSR